MKKVKNYNLLFASIILVLLFLLLLSIYLNPNATKVGDNLDKIKEGLLPEIIGTVLGLMCFYLFYLFFGKSISKLIEGDSDNEQIVEKLDLIKESILDRNVQLIYPNETVSKHLWALKESDIWHSNGHVGRWIRVQVIPYFAEVSKELFAKRQVKIILLNPLNKKVCEDYYNYRRSIEFTDTIENTIDVIAEILATIVVCRFHEVNGGRLEVDIFFNNNFSLFREDISSTAVFRTLVSPKSAAIMYLRRENRSDFYHSAQTDFDYACKNLQPLDRVPFPNTVEITVDNIQQYLIQNKLLTFKDEKLVQNIYYRATNKTKHHRVVTMRF